MMYNNGTSIYNELKSDLDTLIKRFLAIKSLYQQLKILEEWEAPNKVEAIIRGAYFFTLVKSSFRKTIEIDLTIIYDGTSDTSLVKWLKNVSKFIHNNEKHLTKISVSEYSRIIKQHKLKIKNNSKLIKQIRERRNKFWAHIDRHYFKNPYAFYKTLPVQNEELEALIKLTRKILETHYPLWFNGHLTIEVMSTSNLDSVLRHVRAFERVWRDKNLTNNGVQVRVYKEDKYIEGSSLLDFPGEFKLYKK